MATTKIDPQLSGIIRTIISTDKIDNYEKQKYRRLAREAMEIYNRARAFNWVVVFDIILCVAIYIMAIIFAINGYFSYDWIITIVIGTISIIVFSILKVVFRGRFRARVTNLSEELNMCIRNPKVMKCPIVPTVCVIGPYKNSYRGSFVNVRCQGHDGSIPSYSNLGFVFFENRKGGRCTIQFKNKTGVFELKPNECAIITASLSSSMIVVSKSTINVPPSAFEEAPKPIPQQTAPVVQTLSKQEEDLSPLGLIEIRTFDKLGNSFSIPKNNVGFFVLKDNVCDMLKPGNYSLSIDDYPRLKSVNPYAFKRFTVEESPRVIMMDIESVYEIEWKCDELVHAKGVVEFKISDPWLFLDYVFKKDLMLDTSFDAHVQHIVEPEIIKMLMSAQTDNLEFLGKELSISLGGVLNQMGLHIECICLYSFRKEEKSPSETKTTCIHCGKVLPQGSAFCPYCGQKQADHVCPNCGAKLVEGAAFCLKCGTKVN